ncbi:MAG: Crp/Fnr family transcriptional regulator [Methanoregulaceae archaeon]
MDPGTPLDTVYVPFWNLPPQGMAFVLVLSISPLLLYPLELVFLLKIFIYLGYRKIAKTSVLDNEIRKEIYHYVQENPGTFFSAISKDIQVKPGTLQYHLAILKLFGKIALLETNGHTRYFQNSRNFSKTEQLLIKYLQNPTEHIIFEFLIKFPEITRKDLEESLGISGVAVTWHMNRLSQENLLQVTKVGRNARYTLNPEAKHYLEEYLALEPGTPGNVNPEQSPERAR